MISTMATWSPCTAAHVVGLVQGRQLHHSLNKRRPGAGGGAGGGKESLRRATASLSTLQMPCLSHQGNEHRGRSVTLTRPL